MLSQASKNTDLSRVKLG